MKIFTTEGIRHICTKAIERDDMSMLDLMERAAESVTYELMSRWRITQRFVFFAGPGDNGGDALAVARLMRQQGYYPEVYLFNIKSSQMSDCCAANRDRLLELDGIEFIEVTGTFAPPELGPDDVVIDGLFGTGLSNPLKGGYTSLVQYINNSDAFVVSLDMPSGLFGEWNVGTDSRNIIRADLTLTYQFNRLAFFFAENAQYLGEVKVLDMEISLDGVGGTPTDFYLIEKEDVQQVLRRPDKFCNKYDNGAVLLVAGSYGMMGAAVLAARGAMRSGAGIVTVHTPLCGYEVLQTAIPEVIVEPDSDRLITKSIPLNHQYSVVALGPGMGTNAETVDAIDQFIKTFRRPCLLDADALNCIAMRQQLIRFIPHGSVLTPHASEFDRLFGVHHTDEERLKKAIDVSKLYEITIVLKGHYTMTVRPDGKVYINSSGNEGMATAGSGDVLTGVIASLIAQGNAPDWSVVMGVYLHGLAGDIAAREHGTWGVMASDIAENLGRAINVVMSGK
ncbi:MAG: NAD(P)H-hydrate dehydratase [Muribaculaceae bacterium]|nr:NAD(P)H-hydrate dehydratase [Muribaculaceae bacterium]